nr:hypothetical protein [Tanacetum cinerariifolium]
MQTQTSNTLHNAIMEAGRKDRPPMLALNPPYKFTWADKEVPISKCSPVIRTESYMETYKTISQDIRDQLNAKAEAGESINVQDLETNFYWEFRKFTSQDGESLELYYSRSQQAATKNRGKAIVNSPQPIYDQEPSMVAKDDETSKDKEIDKLMALISLLSTRYENQRIGNIAGARENVGSTVVQKSRIQCYNYKEFRHVAKECQKPKRVKDAAYHREKMLLYQELEAHYIYMAQLQEVSPDAADSGPIFDTKQCKRTHQAAARHRGKAVVNSPQLIYDQEPSMVDDDEDTSKDKEIDKLMALISLSFKKIYKPTNNNLRTSSNTSRANQDNSQRIHRNAGYEGQRSGTVAGARDTVGSSMVQKSRIQCYNCKEYGNVARECQKLKRAKDAAYHREKMLLLNRLDEDVNLAKERELLASLIAKLKCEIDESKNR